MKSLFRQTLSLLPDPVCRKIDITSLSLQDTLQNWHMPACYVRAPLPDGQREGTILYFGERPQYKSWTHKFFGQPLEPVPLGQFTLSQILKGEPLALKADITLCPLNPWTSFLFEYKGWHHIPLVINCHIDLSKPVESLHTSKGVKEDLRVARRLGYHFHPLKEDKSAHEFFHQMLIPTAKFRHEERAFLSKWEDIKHILQNGILIAAYLEDQWVGGILLAHEEAETIRLANIGWKDGDDQWRRKGLVAALFNQSFIWARENSYKQVNLGASHPFANDGPLNFKLKWGATLTPPGIHYTKGKLQGARAIIGAKLDLTSPAVQSFLESNPLLEYKKKNLQVLGWNADIPPLFRRQLELGIEWVNLANTPIID